MSRVFIALAVIAAFLAGLVLAYAPMVGDEVSALLSRAGLIAGSHTVSTVTVRSVETVEKTTTITETVTAPPVTSTETITETLTRTVYKTVYSTVSATETVTATTTIREIRVVNPQTYSALQRLANGPEEPGSVKPVYSTDGVTIYDGAYLAIRRPSYPGYYLATIYVYKSLGENSAIGYYLVPCCIETPSMLPPSLLEASRNGFTEYYSSESLAKMLGEGTYTIDVPISKNDAIECNLAVTQYRVTVTGCSVVSVIVSGPRLNGYPSLLDAVLGSYNETTLEKLRGIIWGGHPPRSLAEAAWEALAWMGKHISYDYEKEKSRSPAVYSPLQLVRLGKGVCSDYAVLGAASLLAAGAKRAYVIALDTSPVPHAVAAAWINYTLFILDQHPPLIEAGDYAEYLLGNRSVEAFIIRIDWTTQGPRVKAYQATISPGLDTYPEDRIPESTIEEVIGLVAKATGAKPAPWLETVIRIGRVYTYIDRFLEPLQGISRQEPVPLGALYSPALDKQWAKTLAETATTVLEKYYPEAIGKGSFWLTITRENHSTRIKLYATPFPAPRTTITETGDKLTITIEPINQANTETSTQLIIYNKARKICAAIAPPGYTYQGTPYITATTWETRGDKLVITIDKQRLNTLIEKCSNPVLDIWMNNTIIYSTRLKS